MVQEARFSGCSQSALLSNPIGFTRHKYQLRKTGFPFSPKSSLTRLLPERHYPKIYLLSTS